MYTLMLVDDEPLELETLKDYIPWSTINIGEILTATNGREALELSYSHKIDLVITDIKMPIMDGIEFARQFTVQNGDAKVIFLSGYDDFDCVHSAYQAGGVNYILKPFVKGEVLRVVQEAQEQLERDRGVSEARYAYLEGLLSHIVFGGDTAHATQSLIKNPAFAKVDAVCLLNIDTNATHIQFKEALRPLNRYCYAAHNRNHTVLVLPTPNRIDNIIARLRDSLTSYDGVYCRFVYRRSEIAFDLLHAEWACAEAYKPYLFFLTDTDCIDMDTFVRYKFSDSVPAVLSQLLCSPLRLLHDLVVQYIAEATQQRLCPSLVTEHAIDIALYIAAQCPAVTPALSKQQLMDQLLSANSISEVERMLLELAAMSVSSCTTPDDDKNDRLVAIVMERIERDYATDITAGSLAKEVYLSPNYLRSIFKERAGLTIHDCITKCRMEKAAKLLATHQYKVKEISRLVGYESESYFCAAFLKFFHTTPNNYKNQNWQRGDEL